MNYQVELSEQKILQVQVLELELRGQEFNR
jgi:hypothetical protein